MSTSVGNERGDVREGKNIFWRFTSSSFHYPKFLELFLSLEKKHSGNSNKLRGGSASRFSRRGGGPGTSSHTVGGVYACCGGGDGAAGYWTGNRALRYGSYGSLRNSRRGRLDRRRDEHSIGAWTAKNDGDDDGDAEGGEDENEEHEPVAAPKRSGMGLLPKVWGNKGGGGSGD